MSHLEYLATVLHDEMEEYGFKLSNWRQGYVYIYEHEDFAFPTVYEYEFHRPELPIEEQLKIIRDIAADRNADAVEQRRKNLLNTPKMFWRSTP